MSIAPFSLRGACTGMLMLGALLLTTPAHAAGSLVITQKSPIDVYGDWTLTQPSGGQVTIRGGESKSFPLATAGVYMLMVTPPTDAKLSATVTTEGTQTLATAQRNVSFEIADGQSVEILLSYRYDGTVIVDSEPQGASFELLASNAVRLTGVTPATFTGMAPLTYRVTFQRMEDCYILPQQQRTLGANQTLTFFGRYTCGIASSAAFSSSVSSASSVPSAEVPNERTVRIWAAAHQNEVLPGDIARYTITVKNTGDRTVHDVSVSAQFDEATLTPGTSLPRFGSQEGNVIAWNITDLYAGQFWSVTLPLTVNADLEQGDLATVTARVSASDLTGGGDGQHVASATVGVMTTLPETGMRLDILFLLLATLGTAILAMMQKTQTVKVRA